MKKILKSIANFMFLIFAIPLFIFYKVESLVFGTQKSFQGISQFLSLFPGLSGIYLRKTFYILALKKCSWDCCIGFGTIFSHPEAEIGKHVYIGTRCTIGDVSFGDYATLGSNVDIMNRGKQHYTKNTDTPIQEQEGEYPKVYIEEDAWIGNSSVVMANVGRKCVIGAGSVVVEDIEDYTIAVGNPAQVIRKRV